jgi:hypothetical protein
MFWCAPYCKTAYLNLFSLCAIEDHNGQCLGHWKKMASFVANLEKQNDYLKIMISKTKLSKFNMYAKLYLVHWDMQIAQL